MKLLVAIDDTDMPDTIGTGRLVQNFCEIIKNKNLGICSSISRHQLFVHDDVPYTSHNSTMCFETELSDFSKIFLFNSAKNSLKPILLRDQIRACVLQSYHCCPSMTGLSLLV